MDLNLLLQQREILRLFKANGFTIENQDIDRDSQMLCKTLFGGEAVEIHKLVKGTVEGGGHRFYCLLMDLPDGRLHSFGIKRNGLGKIRTLNTAKKEFPHDAPIEYQVQLTTQLTYKFFLKDTGEAEWDL